MLLGLVSRIVTSGIRASGLERLQHHEPSFDPVAVSFSYDRLHNGSHLASP